MQFEPVFVLRQRQFQNSSILVELLGKNFGRISALAKGAKRKNSKYKGLLRPFNMMLVQLGGKGELKNIIYIEPTKKNYKLVSSALYCGMYMNEISLKLIGKSEGSGDFFHSYESTLKILAAGKVADLALRYFEYELLKEIGFGLDLLHDFDGEKISFDSYYIPAAGKGLVKVEKNKSGAVSGECLYNFSHRMTVKQHALRSLKYLMRFMLNQALAGRQIKSRAILQDYLRLKNA